MVIGPVAIFFFCAPHPAPNTSKHTWTHTHSHCYYRGGLAIGSTRIFPGGPINNEPMDTFRLTLWHSGCFFLFFSYFMGPWRRLVPGATAPVASPILTALLFVYPVIFPPVFFSPFLFLVSISLAQPCSLMSLPVHRVPLVLLGCTLFFLVGPSCYLFERKDTQVWPVYYM